ncbi:MAG: Adaptor for signal transduction [Pycnora praestabilis]|nr:MAG: Adaptor for signal transduction [Pycnora praestabilis]
MAFPSTHFEDSDADDEYERSVIRSPHLPSDSETSPTDSDPPSTEHTPTSYGNFGAGLSSPRGLITDWTAEECVDFVSSLGLSQYSDAFIENEIVGEALIAIKHDELKEMGMSSVGHRLTVLKNVYDVKIKQDVPIEPEHYIPLTAEAGIQDSTATQEDISRIIESIEIRDKRIVAAEMQLRKVTEDYEKLKKDLLPIWRMAKDRSHPLPFHPTSAIPENVETNGSNSQSVPQSEKSGSSLSRKFSTKKLFLGSTPKNSSPTHIPPAVQESKTFNDNTNLDPSAAALAASTHLTASINGGSQPSTSPHQPNIPSPTSPPSYNNQQPPLTSRAFNRDQITPSGHRSMFAHAEEPMQYATNGMNDRDRGNPTPTPATARRFDRVEEPPISAGREAPSVEIFKSFRVSMDDPCYKVLPAALRKYNINADWRQYALYIVYGDQERCLGLEERPLILFKQLDREGKKPMFMLRKHAAPLEGHSGTIMPSSAGLVNNTDPTTLMPRGQQYQNGIQLPGGVL